MKTFAAPVAALALLSCVFASSAQAELPFSHPAVAGRTVALSASAQAQAASPLFIGHPSSPHWVITHANHEHPAVQARLAGAGQVDANTFIVQPPASVQWTMGSAVDSVPVLARQ